MQRRRVPSLRRWLPSSFAYRSSQWWADARRALADMRKGSARARGASRPKRSYDPRSNLRVEDSHAIYSLLNRQNVKITYGM